MARIKKRGAPVSRTGSAFAARAARYIGTPYVWGGDTPKGFDCSGLVKYVLKSMGLRGVPRTSEEQWSWTSHVDPRRLQAGDLIFMNFPGENSPGHVLIYAGAQQAIQAPKPGAAVQQVPFKPLPPNSPMWGGTIVGYGRVPGLTYPTSSAPAGVGGPIGPRSRPGTSSGGGGGGILSEIGGWFSSGAGEAAHLGGDALKLGAEGAVFGPLGFFGSLFSHAAGLISAPLDFLRAALWLLMPQTWLRITEFVVGAVIMVLSLRGLFLIFASQDTPIQFTTVGGAARSLHQRKVQPATDQLVPGNMQRRKQRRDRNEKRVKGAALVAKYGKVPF